MTEAQNSKRVTDSVERARRVHITQRDKGPRAVPVTQPEVFPWARHLSAEEVREFAVESDAYSNLHRVIVEWRATARILADPELTAQLTTPLPDEDHGEVPAP